MITNYRVSPAPAGKHFVGIKGVASMRENPQPDAVLDSQIMFGEDVIVRGRIGDWYDCVVDFCGFDRTGFIHFTELGETSTVPTHWVSAHWAPLLSIGNVRGLVQDRLPKCSLVRVVSEEKYHYQIWPSGFIYKSHLSAIGTPLTDPISALRSLVGVPYIWGGRTVFGVDCAGLIELAMLIADLPCPRARVDMPKYFGQVLPLGQARCAGDVIVFSKHCAMVLDEVRVMHASGALGQVVEESLEDLQAYLRSLGFETDYVHLRPSTAGYPK